MLGTGVSVTDEADVEALGACDPIGVVGTAVVVGPFDVLDAGAEHAATAETATTPMPMTLRTLRITDLLDHNDDLRHKCGRSVRA